MVKFNKLKYYSSYIAPCFSVAFKNKNSLERVILSFSDGNLGANYLGRFSTILEPMRIWLIKNGYEPVNFLYPFTQLKSYQVKHGAIVLNCRFLIAHLVYTVARFLVSDEFAASLKSRCRVFFLKRMIAKINPKAIIAFQATPELCAASHSLGIRVIEPMHGMNVSFEDPIFAKTIKNVDLNCLPDVYLTYDGQTAKSIHKLLDGRRRQIIDTPNPNFVFASQYSSQYGLDFDSNILQKYNKVILYTAQWGYDGERDGLSNILSNGMLHESVMRVINDMPDVYWLIKMHPLQQNSIKYQLHREFFYNLEKTSKNVAVRVCNSLPLPLLFPYIDGHITMSSGSAGEAAQFGIKSLLLCSSLQKGGAYASLYDDLVDSGMCIKAELKSILIKEWIETLLCVPGSRFSQSDLIDKFNTSMSSALEH